MISLSSLPKSYGDNRVFHERFATDAKLCRVAQTLALGLGAALFATYLVVALLRIDYPFELEWMEGGVLDHVGRALNGQKIFAKPSLDFVSYMYPPLYYYVAAVPAAAIGLDFFALRLVSFLSSLGCAGLIFAMVRRETRSRLVGGVSACLYIATFERSGGWFDIARIDSLFMLLMLSGMYAARFARSKAGLVAGGLLVAAAFLVKQSTLVIFAPLMLALAVSDRERAVWFSGTALGAMAVSWLVLDALHEGWFSYYCFTLPSQHPMVRRQIAAFWTEDLLPLAIAIAAALFYLATRWRDGDRARLLFYAALGAGMVGSSWSVRTAVGAWHNNLMPAYAAASVLGGLGLDQLLRGLHAERSSSEPAGQAVRRLRLETAVWALLALQFLLLVWDARDHLPTADDRAAGEQLVERIRRMDGEVFVPHHGYLARRAGKPPQAHTLAMDNVFGNDRGRERAELEGALRRALREQRYAAVLVESDGRYRSIIEVGYARAEPLFAERRVFRPVTGGSLHPATLYLPRTDP